MNLIDDLRYALRVLRKSPAYTVTAIAALGLGIGANTAIFSVFSALLLRSLPYGDPGTLVAVWEDASKMGFPRNTPAPGNFNDWKTGIPAFQDVAAADTYDAILTGDGEPEKIGAASVTSNLFSVCGVQAYAGRRVSGRKAALRLIESKAAPRIQTILLKPSLVVRESSSKRTLASTT
jgi:hypothetical protein